MSLLPGIPYAEPPVGDLRFAPPRLKLSPNTDSGSVFNAVSFGPACLQLVRPLYHCRVPSSLVDALPVVSRVQPDIGRLSYAQCLQARIYSKHFIFPSGYGLDLRRWLF